MQALPYNTVPTGQTLQSPLYLNPIQPPTVQPYSAPVYDSTRVEQLTQQYAAPSVRQLGGALSETLHTGSYADNPAISALSARKALEGYGQGLEGALAGARGQASSQYGQEYNALSGAQQLAWQQQQANLKDYWQEQMRRQTQAAVLASQQEEDKRKRAEQMAQSPQRMATGAGGSSLQRSIEDMQLQAQRRGEAATGGYSNAGGYAGSPAGGFYASNASGYQPTDQKPPEKITSEIPKYTGPYRYRQEKPANGSAPYGFYQAPPTNNTVSYNYNQPLANSTPYMY